MFKVLKKLKESSLWRRESPMATAWQAIGWWESRRVPYNLIVGCVGVLSCMVACIVALGSYFLFNSEFGMPDPPLFAAFAVVLYAIMANVCYTAGWLGELIIRAAWPHQADRYASLTFASGLVFSVLLTATPAVLLAFGGVFGLLGHLLGVVHD